MKNKTASIIMMKRRAGLILEGEVGVSLCGNGDGSEEGEEEVMISD